MSVEIGTTSLDTLPNVNEVVETPVNNQQSNLNMNMNLNNSQVQSNQQSDNNELNINRFVNDIQQASANGGLNLPSRDIPQNPTNITNDETIQENYIPKTSNNDYITEYQTNEQILNKNYNKDENKKKIDNIYNQLSTPLLISLLYFLFQLPVVRNNFYKLFPMCYTVSGNFNILGYILNSILFGLIYFVLNHLLHI
jgi:hypothetical protein